MFALPLTRLLSIAEQWRNSKGIFQKWDINTDNVVFENINTFYKLDYSKINDSYFTEEYKEINIEYTLGIAESGKENRTVRKLISVANQNKKTYNV